MADSADLVVLGAYYGTGNKGQSNVGFQEDLNGLDFEKIEQWEIKNVWKIRCMGFYPR